MTVAAATGRDGAPFALRPAGAGDAAFLVVMLVQAAVLPPGALTDVLADPALAPYVAGWPRLGDVGVMAEGAGRPIGAAWARLFPPDAPGYGFVRPDVPELAVATVPDRRGTGLGGALLRGLVIAAARSGAPGLSLSVRRDNPARRLYVRHGFAPVGRVGESDTMLLEPLPAPER